MAGSVKDVSLADPGIEEQGTTVSCSRFRALPSIGTPDPQAVLPLLRQILQRKLRRNSDADCPTWQKPEA